MFVALYDKNLVPLFKSVSTYPTTTWSLVRNAYEFDEVTIKTRVMDNSSKAVYVGLHNDDGTLKYLAHSGKPKTKNGETVINGTDIRQIFKQRVVIDFSSVGIEDGNFTIGGQTVFLTRLQQIYRYLIGIPLSFPYPGFGSGLAINIDVSDIGEHAPTWNEDYIDRTPGIGNVWDMIQAFNMVYDCYLEVVPSLSERSITFKIRRIYELINFKMSDFNEYKVLNDTAVTNVIDVRVKDEETDEDNVGEHRCYVYLLSNDTVHHQSELNNAADDNLTGETTKNYELIIAPPRMETVLEKDASSALAKAYQELYGNRFKGKAEINTNCSMGYLLRRAGFNTFGKIYEYNSADGRDYRILPLMKISEDDSGIVKVTFGRLTDYWYIR